MKIVEVDDPDEQRRLLRQCKLDIVIAGEPLRDGLYFNAAHGTRDSVLVLLAQSTGEQTVWNLVGGTKQAQKPPIASGSAWASSRSNAPSLNPSIPQSLNPTLCPT